MITHIGYITVILSLVVMQYFERKKMYTQITGEADGKEKEKNAKHFKSAHKRVIEKWRDKRGDK